MRIVLGTAQLGMSYGFQNFKRIRKKEINKIEKLILKSKVKYLDTAIAYSKSENAIGSSKLNKLNIVTKIKLPSKKQVDINKFIMKRISASLQKLKVKNIYGILIHDTQDLFGNKGQILLSSLQNLKKRKIVKYIGVSIYKPEELKKLWKFWKPDLVQAPFNVLDQRLSDSGWLDRLKKNKIKVFVRSCFLQGLLLSDLHPKKNSKKFKKIFNKFYFWCKANKISRQKACIDFIRQYKKIDFIIVGFNNYLQIKEILNIFKAKKHKIPKIFMSNNLNLIDPRRWN